MRTAFLLAGLLVTTSPLYAQLEPLRTKIDQLLQGKHATVGVGIYDFGSQQMLTVNGEKHLPLQRVYKFHIALAMLREVDQGRFRLTQKLHLKKRDMVPKLRSPIRDAYPNGEVDLPLADLIRYMVAEGDNTACDYLLRLLGGPARVDAFVHQLGIREVAIRTTERVQQANWNVQYTNWTTQPAMLSLLKLFYEHKILSAGSHDFLWNVLVAATTGQNRLKKLLPPGTVVAHKTGTSGVTKQGLTGAINDIGFIVPPNGKCIAISVFVSNSTESTETNERLIAAIAQVAYTYFGNAN